MTKNLLRLTKLILTAAGHLSHCRRASIHPSSGRNPVGLIGDICQQAALIPPTKFKDCVATFASKPGSSSADLKGLAGITLRSAVANATEAGKYVEGLLKDGYLGPALRKCSSSFTAAASSFESALVEIEEDVMSANYDAKIAGDDARNCRFDLFSFVRLEI